HSPHVLRAAPQPVPRGRDVELLVLDDAEAAAAATVERLAEAARAGAEIALTGGSTPRRAYELAAEREPDWSRAGAWWGDERCVDPADERSNYRLARESLLDRLARRPGVTLPLAAPEAGAETLFLVGGADKAEAARRAFVDEPSERTPASLVRAASGATLAILDRAAAASIEK